eukprot:CAMPEP_0202904484 /NCGR_PEP_ID=MMETSP1392-20130828/29614_1 /ASSEMBLY_ACC=CAM_ASM_000868 /TAXON_ID=225041 /ORGANISM="Chlamydomonas chlamydogama, Strain SAG 11-48b" /LENGTH=863 /DNA_ID=CAMNT_0049592123 /DNA_START=148 /DNA_END=2739 /DNA_ORIENTATION=-
MSGKKLALVVGLCYSDSAWSGQRHAGVSSAVLACKHLFPEGQGWNSVLLADDAAYGGLRRPTARFILEELGRIARSAPEGSEMVFYFSGQAVQLQDRALVGHSSTSLVAADYPNLITLDDVFSAVSPVKGRNISFVMVLDCCSNPPAGLTVVDGTQEPSTHARGLHTNTSKRGLEDAASGSSNADRCSAAAASILSSSALATGQGWAKAYMRPAAVVRCADEALLQLLSSMLGGVAVTTSQAYAALSFIFGDMASARVQQLAKLHQATAGSIEQSLFGGHAPARPHVPHFANLMTPFGTVQEAGIDIFVGDASARRGSINGTRANSRNVRIAEEHNVAVHLPPKRHMDHLGFVRDHVHDEPSFMELFCGCFGLPVEPTSKVTPEPPADLYTTQEPSKASSTHGPQQQQQQQQQPPEHLKGGQMQASAQLPACSPPDLAFAAAAAEAKEDSRRGATAPETTSDLVQPFDDGGTSSLDGSTRGGMSNRADGSTKGGAAAFVSASSITAPVTSMSGALDALQGSKSLWGPQSPLVHAPSPARRLGSGPLKSALRHSQCGAYSSTHTPVLPSIYSPEPPSSFTERAHSMPVGESVEHEEPAYSSSSSSSSRAIGQAAATASPRSRTSRLLQLFSRPDSRLERDGRQGITASSDTDTDRVGRPCSSSSSDSSSWLEHCGQAASTSLHAVSFNQLRRSQSSPMQAQKPRPPSHPAPDMGRKAFGSGRRGPVCEGILRPTNSISENGEQAVQKLSQQVQGSGAQQAEVQGVLPSVFIAACTPQQATLDIELVSGSLRVACEHDSARSMAGMLTWALCFAMQAWRTQYSDQDISLRDLVPAARMMVEHYNLCMASLWQDFNKAGQPALACL